MRLTVYVGKDGVAKSVKAIYVGVNGVAKCIMRPSGIYKYDRLVPPLSVARSSLAATTVGNYALFAGGLGDTWYDTIDVYDKSLTKITPVHLSAGKYGCKGTTIDKKYALFFGGNIGDSSEPGVDVFDSSLVRTIMAGPNDERIFLAATTVGNYALFAGGYDYDSSPRTKDEVYAYMYEL